MRRNYEDNYYLHVCEENTEVLKLIDKQSLNGRVYGIVVLASG